MILLCEGANKFTRHYERFLVGEGYGLACADGFYRWTQARITHHGSHHDINRWHRYHLRYRISACPHFHHLCIRTKSRLEFLLKFEIQTLIGNAHYLRTEIARLLHQLIY